ncbi:hypothetical protein BC828DRAFT_376600 [Blastocladiella britannica]|nr:hypothetical protein BC828DRAFT_376600 [Blastocladiella britannica]
MRKMLMGRQERVLAIDGEYLHVLPSESRASMFDSVKTSSYHVSAVLACKQNKKLPAHFRLEVLRNPSSASGGPSPGGTGAGAATATTNSGGGALLSSDVPGSLAFGVAGPGGTGGGGGPGSGNAIGPTPRRSMGSTGAGNGASGSGGGSGAAGITKDSGSGLTGIAGIAGEVTRSHVVAPAMSYNAREGKTFDFEARSADEAREICAAIATLVSAVRRRASGSGGG